MVCCRSTKSKITHNILQLISTILLLVRVLLSAIGLIVEYLKLLEEGGEDDGWTSEASRSKLFVLGN